jgi:hypothetical protein
VVKWHKLKAEFQPDVQITKDIEKQQNQLREAGNHFQPESVV